MAKQNLGRVVLVPRGEYKPDTQYKRLDLVSYHGSSYIVLQPVINEIPSKENANYSLMAEKGDPYIHSEEFTSIANQVRADKESATQKASEASASAGAAKTSETNTSDLLKAATQKASEAETSAVNAKASEDAANSLHISTQQEAQNAKASAADALSYKTSAEQSAVNAQTACTSASESEKVAGQFADAAKQSETNATQLLETTTQKASEANQSALNAAGSATAAGESAGAAKTSETNAALSLETATQKASEANQSALNAKASEDAAKQSAADTLANKDSVDASVLNINAVSAHVDEQAKNVTALEGSTQTAATNAAQSASDASQYATNASGSANAAKQSETQSGENLKSVQATDTDLKSFTNTAKADMTALKDRSEQAVTKVEAAVVHEPKHVDGFWHVWDFEQQKYVNTNVRAEAEDSIWYGETPPPEGSHYKMWINPKGEPGNRLVTTDYLEERLKAGLAPNTWSEWQKFNRLGLSSNVLSPGDQFSVERLKEITAETSGTGISGATVDGIKFITAKNKTKAGTYIMQYDGTTWLMDEEKIIPEQYGVTITGSPAKGDKVILTETTDDIIFDVSGIDYDVPSEPGLTHSISLITHDCVTNCAFDNSELLWYCNAEEYPDGLPAGTYNLTLDHASYGGGLEQDGTYQFTTTQVIPVGGGFRHSSIGSYQSTGYTKQQIVDGKFTTYNAERATIESGLVTTEEATGTNLGTCTRSEMRYRVSPNFNFTQRHAYGSNNWEDSAIVQYLNSNKASDWNALSNPFDMKTSSPKSGFLYGLDPSFVAVLGKVKKRTYQYPDGRSEQKYIDSDELVHLVSMTEVGFGANDGVYETPVLNGEAKTTPLPLYVDATATDRIKYLNDVARWWWLRGGFPWYSNGVRGVSTSGELSHDLAYSTGGVAAGLCII